MTKGNLEKVREMQNNLELLNSSIFSLQSLLIDYVKMAREVEAGEHYKDNTELKHIFDEIYDTIGDLEAEIELKRNAFDELIDQYLKMKLD